MNVEVKNGDFADSWIVICDGKTIGEIWKVGRQYGFGTTDGWSSSDPKKSKKEAIDALIEEVTA